jgi:hypothetical protein
MRGKRSGTSRVISLMRCASQLLENQFLNSECLLRQVQDWLYTREAAKATVAHAIEIASSKQARLRFPPPSHSSFAMPLNDSAHSISPLDITSSARSSRPGVLSSTKKTSGSALPSKQQLPRASAPSARARSSSPSRTPALTAIDAAITSMVAGGASGTTAVQRHLGRASARAPPTAAAGGGAPRRQHAATDPSQQLFSVIL